MIHRKAASQLHGIYPFIMRRDRGRPLLWMGDLAVVIVRSVECVARIYDCDDLDAFDVDPSKIFLQAQTNLRALVDARLVQSRVLRGPHNVPVLAFGHSTLAASCLLLPGLWEVASNALGIAGTFFALVVRRDLFVVFPTCEPSILEQVVIGLSRWAEPRDALSGALYKLDDSGQHSLEKSGSRSIATFDDEVTATQLVA